jgi:nicotinate-nucleotide pyrophosphorylase (carboxylating)
MDFGDATLRECVRRALAEDLGSEQLDPSADITGRLVLPAGVRGKARIVAKAEGVLAGMACAGAGFHLLDPQSRVEAHRQDGQRLRPGDVVLEVHGGVAPLLAAERTVLNFLQRLSGIATVAATYVAAVAGTRARILDTRKTTPGLRHLEKMAVVAGGGQNHRIGLYDQVLLKENHFGFARPIDYEDVVRRAVAGHDRPVVAEARNLREALAAVRGGAGVVLLDNFQAGPLLADVVQAVRQAALQLGRSVEIEASGGVSLATVRRVAEFGVDRISIGALTHSAPALDLSMLVEGVE